MAVSVLRNKQAYCRIQLARFQSSHQQASCLAHTSHILVGQRFRFTTSSMSETCAAASDRRCMQHWGLHSVQHTAFEAKCTTF